MRRSWRGGWNAWRHDALFRAEQDRGHGTAAASGQRVVWAAAWRGRWLGVGSGLAGGRRAGGTCLAVPRRVRGSWQWQSCHGLRPRRGRRVLPVTLGRHHKPFGSARTARALRALDLVGALHALWRTERRGAREKVAIRIGERYATGPTTACSTAPERPRMGTGPAQRQPYGPGGHVPRMQASNPPAGGSMARPPKWDSRVPATLVPDGAAPHALRRVTQARWVASAHTSSG
eukprot:scaffold13071_cov61-Phaeocystis_antarctica.AAC.5